MKDHEDTTHQPHPTRWTLRAGVVAAGAVLAAAVPATGALAAPAAPAKVSAVERPAAVQSGAVLGNLTVIDTEDWSADGDEPYIKVNGVRVWAAADSVDVGGVLAVNIRVNPGDTVSLYDEDSPDADDLLGSDVVDGTQGSLVFKGSNSYYTLDYHAG